MQSPTCVIGAGSSGLVAIKQLLARGLPFDCFELGSQLGGLWRYNNDNGMSAAYESLHINSSKGEMAFSDFPMPGHFPDFPHHSQILQYFEDYAAHFQLGAHIQFKHRVEQVEPCEGGGYQVTVTGPHGKPQTRRYGSVIVANGHHWCPRIAEFPGQFHGRSLHSHDYRTPEEFRGQRVLVVGIGNSACDIACDLSRVAEQTVLSTRRGAHVIPKYLFGRPLDRICPPVLWNVLPHFLLKRLFAVSLYLARGRMRRYGLPTPKHQILEEHPTVSADLLNRLGHGKIRVRPNVEALQGDQVRFVDGASEPFDSIIYATGYRIRFPFLSDAVLASSSNEVRLYRKVVHPEQPGLYFVGLVQPWGPLMPLAEAQSDWIAELVSGQAVLPTRANMFREIQREHRAMQRRYITSERHTIQVDFHPYLRQLKREKSACLRRAARSGKASQSASSSTTSASARKAA